MIVPFELQSACYASGLSRDNDLTELGTHAPAKSVGSSPPEAGGRIAAAQSFRARCLQTSVTADPLPPMVSFVLRTGLPAL